MGAHLRIQQHLLNIIKTPGFSRGLFFHGIIGIYRDIVIHDGHPQGDAPTHSKNSNKIINYQEILKILDEFLRNPSR
jgi:hypothetical protein